MASTVTGGLGGACGEIVGEPSNEALPVRGDLGAVEPCRTQQSGNRVAEVAGRVVAAPDEPRREAVAVGQLAADVDQMQPSAGTQHPEHLVRRGGFRVLVEMMQ